MGATGSKEVSSAPASSSASTSAPSHQQGLPGQPALQPQTQLQGWQVLSAAGQPQQQAVPLPQHYFQLQQQPLQPLQQQLPPSQQAVLQPVRQACGPPRMQSQPPWRPGPSHHGHFGDVDSEPTNFADDDELAVSTASAAASAQPEPEVTASGALTVTTRVEYTSLPRGAARDVFGIVTLQAALNAGREQGLSEQRQHLDIVCVLDVSGSMAGNKLRLLQDAVRFVVRESQPQDRLSLVTFNDGAKRPLRLRRMDAHGKDEATAATLRLVASGGTDITRGLEMGLRVFEQRRHRNPVSAILLLTDGQDGSSGQSYAPLIERATRAGCSLYTFGFGADHDARLLSSLAEQAQTPFTFVEDVGQIGAAFAGAMGGLSTVAAQRIEVTIDCRVGLKAVHTPFPLSRAGDRAVIQIPDLLAGERRDVLVELSVPEAAELGGEEELLLLGASARYWDLSASAAAQTPAAEMRLRRLAADEPQPELEPDEEVVTQRNRVQVAQALEEATAHGEAGRFEEAQAVLAAHQQRLRAAKHLSPIDEGLAAELQDASVRMRSRSSWEQGGMAEVRDAMQMHKMQRTTNVSATSASPAKCSKQMYATPCQQEWISKQR